jgi:hypothetical protein
MNWLGASILLIGAVTLAASTYAADTSLSVTAECHDVEIPNEDLWMAGGHADAEAEAFVHWDEDDPPEVPASCAKCHSTPGFRDFLGADGTKAGVVDNAAPIGTTIECTACHNVATADLSSIVMPSGAEITGLGSEAVCMQCHQGRESSVSVDAYLADKGPTETDEVNASLSFRNIHYFPAGATQLGTFAKGGYQYEGKSYDAKSAHVSGIDTCVDCHNPHSLEVQVHTCVTCHPDVTAVEDLKNVRMVSSAHDYDGDGDVAEGIYYEIKGLQEILYAAIQAYAGNAGTPIAYDGHSYPYFFVDDNANGAVDADETTWYNAFTPRLIKATFNYQFSMKDPGAFAHGGKYMIQLLHDSIEDLDATLVANLARVDAGHFAGSEEPWRHWDKDGEVSGGCSKCHSADGLPFFLKEGVTISQPLSNGLMCETCHDSLPEFTRRVVEEVTFPSGAQLDTGDPDSNLCINCHQGRESGARVDAAIAGLDLDTVSDDLQFINVHYFPAGATLFGTQAQGAYQYEGKAYHGRFKHISSFDTCTECHDTHALSVQTNACGNSFCHGTTNVRNIRKSQTDFDGDGSVTEGLAGEIESLADILLGAMMDYARDVVGKPIAYDGHSYPYFFNDDNDNGQIDEGESGYGNRYQSWTPRLLRAAYNYQYSQKDPGAFAHNGAYVIQVLYDSLEDLGAKVPVDTTGMVRP